MKLEIKNNLDELGKVRKSIRDFCFETKEFGLNDKRVDMIELGIHEILVNIIRHAYKMESDQSIRITARLDSNQIIFELFDHGISFNFETVPPPQFDGSRENGFGIWIASQAFEKIEYIQNTNEENHTILTFTMGGE